MKAAVDTNVLVYVEEQSLKGDAARRFVVTLPARKTVLPVQVCGELYNVLTRKSRLSASVALAFISQWRSSFLLAETTHAVLAAAFELASTHQLQIWDAVILAASADTGCDLLLSEDLQDGFRWRGVTVVNPFAATTSPLLDAFLAQP